MNSQKKICKCAKNMMFIADGVYYCTYCGRLLDADSIDFPGDVWFEPKRLFQLEDVFKEIIKYLKDKQNLN